MSNEAIAKCEDCNGDGFVIADATIPVGKDGRYKICSTCKGSGNQVVEDKNKNCWLPIET